MGNRPCRWCGKTTWFWSDPELGCNLCNPDETPTQCVHGHRTPQVGCVSCVLLFKAIASTAVAIATNPMANPPTLDGENANLAPVPEWNGDPLQGHRCDCGHTLGTHSPKTGRCLYPKCGCPAFVATEPYAPRTES